MDRAINEHYDRITTSKAAAACTDLDIELAWTEGLEKGQLVLNAREERKRWRTERIQVVLEAAYTKVFFRNLYSKWWSRLHAESRHAEIAEGGRMMMVVKNIM